MTKRQQQRQRQRRKTVLVNTRALTSKDSLVRMKFTTKYRNSHVAQLLAVQQSFEVVAQTTLGHPDRWTTLYRRTNRVHRDADLNTATDQLNCSEKEARNIAQIDTAISTSANDVTYLPLSVCLSVHAIRGHPLRTSARRGRGSGPMRTKADKGGFSECGRPQRVTFIKSNVKHGSVRVVRKHRKFGFRSCLVLIFFVLSFGSVLCAVCGFGGWML